MNLQRWGQYRGKWKEFCNGKWVKADEAALEIRLLQEQIEQLRSDVERLQAVVDRIEKTADGVPAVEGDTIFVILEHDGTIQEDVVGASHAECYNEYGVSECYSTREAAEKARKT